MIKSNLREILLKREINYETPYTIQDVADVTSLNRNTVANLVHGHTTRYDAPVLDALCRALGVQVGDLLVYVPDGEE